MSHHILLVEDDSDFSNILKQYLQLFDYTVVPAKDSIEALAYLQKEHYDLCILDVMLPKMDGFTLAERMLQLNPEIPFIFLTARKTKADKIKGLKLGADDYIVKPFEADELVLRLKNILKRKTRMTQSTNLPSTYKIGSYAFDGHRHLLSHPQEQQRLTQKEAALIHYLYGHQNTLIKRADILMAIWGNDDFFSGRSMDVFISRLRKYFRLDDNIKIESIRGIGLEFQITK